MNALGTIARSELIGFHGRVFAVLFALRYAGSRATRWIATVVIGLCILGTVVLAVVMPDATGQRLALYVYAVAAGTMAMWTTGLLLLARDAHRLRVPGVHRNTINAATVYLLACVAAPVIVVAAIGGDAWLAMLIPALAMAAGLAFVLLPRWMSLWLSFVPAIYMGLHSAFHIASPFSPQYRHWTWLALAVLAIADLIRWRQLARGVGKDDNGWRSTMLLQMRQTIVTGDCGSARNWNWRRPADRITDVDFREVGPHKPARTIQVSLGGWYVPQTLRSRLGALSRVALPLLLFVPLMLLMSVGHGKPMHKLWIVVGVSGALWVGLFGAAILAFVAAAIIQRRWKHHASIATLALLPGLGGGRAFGMVLRAVLAGPAVGFVLAWLCMLVPLLLLHRDLMVMLLTTLFVLAMASFTIMAVVRVLAGRPLRTAAQVIIGVALMVLTDASLILASSRQADTGNWASSAIWLAVLGWLVFIAWALWQAIRAWRTLRCRPHPFLANAP